jgi:hypothetical protein
LRFRIATACLACGAFLVGESIFALLLHGAFRLACLCRLAIRLLIGRGQFIWLARVFSKARRRCIVCNPAIFPFVARSALERSRSTQGVSARLIVQLSLAFCSCCCGWRRRIRISFLRDHIDVTHLCLFCGSGCRRKIRGLLLHLLLELLAFFRVFHDGPAFIDLFLFDHFADFAWLERRRIFGFRDGRSEDLELIAALGST